MPFVIGTAGHVDHGKSTLVRALTGIDPDRLAEEKAREMTIDLGFAWLTLPNGESVGIIDVPGHRDFIENMLAGVGGIDLALFVIAADEGIMPQTREHLAIIDLLKIPGGIIALTKIDMISDPDWIDLIMLDIAEATVGSVLENAPIIPVSARTGEGLDDIVASLQAAVMNAEPRSDYGRPRLPVDRVFTISGFGTVVTGTLIDGSLNVGDEVEVLPSGKRARIRGLQNQKQGVSEVNPGNRAALNLGGITTHDIKRGDVITLPGLLQPSTLIDVQFEYLPNASRPLMHNSSVKLFTGAFETTATVRVIGAREISPGETGWLQLRLEHPTAVDRNDRFILRYPSPAETIGGGRVLDPNPRHRWRRFKPDVISRMETLAAGRVEDSLLQQIEEHILISREQASEGSGLSADDFKEALTLLESRGAILYLNSNSLMTTATWNRLKAMLEKSLTAYHIEHPLQAGQPRQALRSQLGLDAKVFNRIIDFASGEGVLINEGVSVRLPTYTIRFTERQQQAVEALKRKMVGNPSTPPTVKEAQTIVGEEVLRVLIERGDLIQLSEEVIFNDTTYQAWVDEIEAYLRAQESITVAQARDLLGSSRKYIVAFLEHLDEKGITKRVGDARILRNPKVHQ